MTRAVIKKIGCGMETLLRTNSGGAFRRSEMVVGAPESRTSGFQLPSASYTSLLELSPFATQLKIALTCNRPSAFRESHVLAIFSWS